MIPFVLSAAQPCIYDDHLFDVSGITFSLKKYSEYPLHINIPTSHLLFYLLLF